MYKNYIYLNGKLFQFVDRKHSKFNSGRTTINRSLNNTGWSDNIGVSKHRWTFTFNQDSRGVKRLSEIWEVSTLSLQDWDGITYPSVKITNDFEEVFNGEDYFTIQLNLEEL